MKKLLAFDVSETLQTMAEHNDRGYAQPMVDEKNEEISGMFNILIGGDQTADLLRQAQELGINIVLVTNNGQSEFSDARARTLKFLACYGVNLQDTDYYSPEPTQDGNSSKVIQLNKILEDRGLTKEEILFFDDSINNCKEATEAGFEAIHVHDGEQSKAEILHTMIKSVVKIPQEKADLAAAKAKTDDAQLKADIARTYKEQGGGLFARFKLFGFCNNTSGAETLDILRERAEGKTLEDSASARTLKQFEY